MKSYIDVDRDSVNYGKVKIVERRKNFLNYVKEKQIDKIKKVLIHYNVFSQIDIHDKWTLVNAFTDLCAKDVAERLLPSEDID